jgi:hypothetical protein
MTTFNIKCKSWTVFGSIAGSVLKLSLTTEKTRYKEKCFPSLQEYMKNVSEGINKNIGKSW